MNIQGVSGKFCNNAAKTVKKNAKNSNKKYLFEIWSVHPSESVTIAEEPAGRKGELGLVRAVER